MTAASLLGLQPDGRIFALSSNVIVRLERDGALDPVFQAILGNALASPPVVEKLLVEPDGKILVGGQFTQINGVGRTNVAGLLADGSIDMEFQPAVDDRLVAVLLASERR